MVDALPPLDDTASHLLVVDDDRRIRELLSRYLMKAGFRVTVAPSADAARKKMVSLSFDLVVLDVMMPGTNGFDFVTEIRENLDVPVLMLTARSESEDRIKGLELGADDYLAKPFEPRELVLRIGKLLSRHSGPAEAAKPTVVFGPFEFHRNRRELRQGETVIRLTERERELMAAFAELPGETVPRYTLVDDDTMTSARTIDVQITRLRRKIEADPANPLYLQTVRGIGYRLMCD